MVSKSEQYQRQSQDAARALAEMPDWMQNNLTPPTETIKRFGFGDGGHEFDPDRHGRCRKAGSGYCDGTRADSAHEERS